jgi:hypothetical protein
MIEFSSLGLENTANFLNLIIFKALFI